MRLTNPTGSYLDMPDGTINDVRDITTMSISHQTANYIAQYRETWWVTNDVRTFSWVNLSDDLADDYVTFILANLGKEIVVSEYHTEETLTVIHVPDTIDIVRTNSCRNSITTIFYVVNSSDVARYYLSTDAAIYLHNSSGVQIEVSHL